MEKYTTTRIEKGQEDRDIIYGVSLSKAIKAIEQDLKRSNINIYNSIDWADIYAEVPEAIDIMNEFQLLASDSLMYRIDIDE